MLGLVALERPDHGIHEITESADTRSISDLHTAMDSNGYDSDDILSQALDSFEEKNLKMHTG